MPKVVEDVDELSNIFICFPGSYLFFGTKESKNFLKLVESQDIGLLSYNLASGNVVVAISAKDLAGSLDYAGLVHLTPSTINSFDSILQGLPKSYRVKAYLVGDSSYFEEVSKVLKKRGIVIESSFPKGKEYQHVVLWWEPINGLHMSIKKDVSIPRELLSLISKAKNIDNISKSLISINKHTLLPAFELDNKLPKLKEGKELV